jgi:hypothetical protein
MSYKVGSNQITLRCDGCGDARCQTVESDNLSTMRDLWSKVSRQGWTSTSERHYCRSCSRK